MEIISEPEWHKLFHELKNRKGISIIIGATDSGKSTLIRFLISNFVSEKINVCLVDSDVGQSSLGLPGTICMKLFRNENDLNDYVFDRMSFVGTVNPAKNISLIIEKTKMMSDICKTYSNVTMIDTSGLISGEIGKALKTSKIGAIHPDYIIAIQRYDELEHLLINIKDIPVYRLKTPAAAKIRSISIRTLYRKNKLENYFKKAGVDSFVLYKNEVLFFYNGKPFNMNQSIFKKGTLIGLNHLEDTIALGIVDEVTDDSLIFRSPIKSIKNINRVIWGDMTMP